MDDNKRKKIVAIVIAAIISLLLSIAATVWGIQPNEIADVMPDNGLIQYDPDCNMALNQLD